MSLFCFLQETLFHTLHLFHTAESSSLLIVRFSDHTGPQACNNLIGYQNMIKMVIALIHAMDEDPEERKAISWDM